MIEKIAIGTAQFGMDYGINNRTGQVSKSEAERILLQASEAGIDTLDTASAYGNSEETIGSALGAKKLFFKIVTKLPPEVSTNNLQSAVQNSLEKLKVESIYAVLFHHSKTFFQNERIWEQLANERIEGRVKKIGFSLYEPEELELLFKSKISFDIIQVPYNVLNRKFEDYFGELKNRNVEIHVRSVFLQGLFFLPDNALPTKLYPLKKVLDQFKEILKAYQLNTHEGALQFVGLNPYINRMVLGMETAEQLSNNIESAILTINPSFMDDVRLLKVSNPELLNPVNWK